MSNVRAFQVPNLWNSDPITLVTEINTFLAQRWALARVGAQDPHDIPLNGSRYQELHSKAVIDPELQKASSGTATASSATTAQRGLRADDSPRRYIKKLASDLKDGVATFQVASGSYQFLGASSIKNPTKAKVLVAYDSNTGGIVSHAAPSDVIDYLFEIYYQEVKQGVGAQKNNAIDLPWPEINLVRKLELLQPLKTANSAFHISVLLPYLIVQRGLPLLFDATQWPALSEQFNGENDVNSLAKILNGGPGSIGDPNSLNKNRGVVNPSAASTSAPATGPDPRKLKPSNSWERLNGPTLKPGNPNDQGDVSDFGYANRNKASGSGA